MTQGESKNVTYLDLFPNEVHRVDEWLTRLSAT